MANIPPYDAIVFSVLYFAVRDYHYSTHAPLLADRRCATPHIVSCFLYELSVYVFIHVFNESNAHLLADSHRKMRLITIVKNETM
jgi:phosphatidylserine decarboxylase